MIQWPAISIGLASFYVIFIRGFESSPGLPDLFILVLTLGVGFAMGRFERRSSDALRDLSRFISKEEEIDVRRDSDRSDISG